ncbi:ABC-2 type transporter [Musa troglodytarum]|uniref:ABC-2 type transporter n=1 Tax=Musa troglodytarum TaxID=320322 RepID=A0A9E7G4V8_9LILI|nr:ABC-2 type transporter [Musa troglodytarum]
MAKGRSSPLGTREGGRVLLSAAAAAGFHVEVGEEREGRDNDTGDGAGRSHGHPNRRWATKGISGRQKQRVSICIEVSTRPQLLFLDEPTNGLDSVASYHAMDRITKLARREGMTIVVAIHQPSSEVFELFHGLCLLAYGRTVVFGPASMTNEGGVVVKKKNQASFMTQSLVLTGRCFVNIFGSIQARGSMLMFTAAFLTFMAIRGFPSFAEDTKIFGRERLNGHYGVTAFTIANTLSATPYLALISMIPRAMAYFLVGLQRLPNDLPKPVWRYPMYYITFHKYANQGFYKNEFMGLIFPNTQAGGPPSIIGDEISRET